MPKQTVMGTNKFRMIPNTRQNLKQRSCRVWQRSQQTKQTKQAQRSSVEQAQQSSVEQAQQASAEQA